MCACVSTYGGLQLRVFWLGLSTCGTVFDHIIPFFQSSTLVQRLAKTPYSRCSQSQIGAVCLQGDVLLVSVWVFSYVPISSHGPKTCTISYIKSLNYLACVCVPRGRDEFLPLIPSVLGQAMDGWVDGCISTYQGEGMSVLQLVW